MENLPGTEPTGGQTGTTNPPERMFTESRVKDLMRKRVERSHNSFFKRYGVSNLEELDQLFEKAGQLTSLQTQFDELTQRNAELMNQHKDLTKRYAYKIGNINPEKMADIEAYFKGKNLDIDESTLGEELKTHPDWAQKPVTMESLGAETHQSGGVNEAEEASRYFGVDLT
jgi:DNA-directed RNA polymerase subunit F